MCATQRAWKPFVTRSCQSLDFTYVKQTHVQVEDVLTGFRTVRITATYLGAGALINMPVSTEVIDYMGKRSIPIIILSVSCLSRTQE